jgi:esterase/lipase
MDKTLSEMQGELPVAAPSSATVERTPTYFGAETDALFGWLHRPKLVAQRQTGLLICPPIGHEYVHSHRPLRHLADHLAAAGFATLRFDYHGSGDSGGLNQDPGRVSAWLDSIRQAITALKTQSGCTDIGLLGVRMGATFASIIAAEQDVQQLVVWEPCVQGRRFVRELKALHMTASAAPAASAAANQDIESAGFVITRETAEDLGKLNLKDITPRTTHVFIGERDDAVDDYSLRDAWLENGR